MLSTPIQTRQTPYTYRRPTIHLNTPLRVGGNTTPSTYPLSSYPDTSIQDRFLDPKHNLSSQQALGLFLGGLTLGLAGKSMWRFLKPTPPASEPTHLTILDNATTERKLQVYQNFNEALSSIYRLVVLDPSQGNALLAYAGASVLGYLSGSVVQGSKDTWVRREETRIRAKLINRLQPVLRQSIQNKKQFDTALKEELRNRLTKLLQANGVINVDDLIQEIPVVESIWLQRNYPIHPISRKVASAAMHFRGLNKKPEMMPPTENPPLLISIQKALIFGSGALSGFALHGFIKLLRFNANQEFSKGQSKAADKMGDMKIEVMQSSQMKDWESWILAALKDKKNFALTAGFFAMSAAAHIGKTLLDGLREVEVTRLNARTELDYQTHNWLTQDPAFHEIAEREAANQDLAQLERDLSRLKYNPELLRQRVQTILANVGRNSAPPYFPMTPMVNLVEARA